MTFFCYYSICIIDSALIWPVMKVPQVLSGTLIPIRNCLYVFV